MIPEPYTVPRAEPADCAGAAGPWVQTYTGRRLYPCDPRPEDVALVDVAHALAHLCRFNGHTKRFYSVAQHCILVSEWVGHVAAVLKLSERHTLRLRRLGLLHDAAEAYLGDLVRPLKDRYKPFKADEDRLGWAILSACGLAADGMVSDWDARLIKLVDDWLLTWEAAHLLAPPPEEWTPLPLPGRAGDTFADLLDPAEAKAAYLTKCVNLGLPIDAANREGTL